jgi:hypothetical protein
LVALINRKQEGFSMPAEAERKAFNLHASLSDLLRSYEEISPLPNPGTVDPIAARAERALFENRPLADWEPEKGEA